MQYPKCRLLQPAYWQYRMSSSRDLMHSDMVSAVRVVGKSLILLAHSSQGTKFCLFSEGSPVAYRNHIAIRNLMHFFFLCRLVFYLVSGAFYLDSFCLYTLFIIIHIHVIIHMTCGYNTYFYMSLKFPLFLIK